MVNIYKFFKKDILIQPPGEPREQHLGDVRPKKFELHKISWKQNEPKGRYTQRIFEKNAKKLKMKLQERKNVVLCWFIRKHLKKYFFGSCYFNFNFLQGVFFVATYFQEFAQPRNIWDMKEKT